MSDTLGLSDLAGKPILSIAIDGQLYHFSQLPVLPQKANLDAFLREKIPNPMDVIKPHLVGLEPDDRRYLLNEARKEAADWPPCLETQRGRLALLGLESGLMELFFQALTVHHPGMTREKSRELYAAFEREQSARGLGEVRRMVTKLMVIWFNGRLAEDDEGLPKDGGSHSSNGSTGSFSFAGASAS